MAIDRQNGNAEDNSLVGYKFSPEELKAFEECNWESFSRRSVPFSIVAGVGVFYAVKAGVIKPSLKYGAAPKMIAASIFGYIFGKVSYQSKCAEKFMRIPNSKIGKALREKSQKGAMLGGFGGDFDPGFGSTFGSPSGSSAAVERGSDSFNEISPRTYADLDIDRPLSNLDDSFSSNNYNQTLNVEDSLPSVPPSQLYTYDELRKKNREEFEQSRIKPHARQYPPPPQPPPVASQDDYQTREAPQESNPTPPPLWNKRRNIYGDVWEK